ncbi:MAG: cation:proton antiporter, partial [candidate division Zixibacteria bacterium]|nr:cation:proton antiporter [candidate division Zixibacteria bacterium]
MPLLTDIVIILGLSVIAVFLFQRIRLPSILGFLLSGIIAGPQGLGLIKATHDIQFLAELGVILLLFAIGIEFSLKNLLRIRKSALLGGSLQVLLTILVSSILVRQTGLSLEQSIFTGFLISLSSTAIVLKLLQERAEIDSPHGRTALGILIFQDVIIVPMILVTPILAGASGSVEQSFLLLGIKSILIIFL